MNSTDYQVNLLRERIRELETRMLQIEDRVVFHPPAQRKPLTSTWIWWWLRKWCDSHPSLRQETYNSLFKMVKDAEAIEAKLREKNA